MAGRDSRAGAGFIALTLTTCAMGLMMSGCGIVPTQEIRTLGRAFPTSAPITDQQRAQIATRIRAESGLTEFNFTDTRLPVEHRAPSLARPFMSSIDLDGEAP